jgi:hypothetical protein
MPSKKFQTPQQQLASFIKTFFLIIITAILLLLAVFPIILVDFHQLAFRLGCIQPLTTACKNLV